MRQDFPSFWIYCINSEYLFGLFIFIPSLCYSSVLVVSMTESFKKKHQVWYIVLCCFLEACSPPFSASPLLLLLFFSLLFKIITCLPSLLFTSVFSFLSLKSLNFPKHQNVMDQVTQKFPLVDQKKIAGGGLQALLQTENFFNTLFILIGRLEMYIA